MSKFNKQSTNQTVNFAGGKAYKESHKLELASILLTSFVADQYYESANDRTNRLKNVIAKVNPLFVAKAAVYTRQEFGLRSISHVAAGELAQYVSGQTWGRSFYKSVVKRPDDITEILSYYLGRYGKKMPHAMVRGLGSAFDKFDEYQLAKYRMQNKEVKLVDAVNLLHPKPTTRNGDALKKLISGDLVSRGTWEADLTKAGQTAKTDDEKQENKKKVWVDLVTSGKIGYFALLRNLRNILDQAPDLIPEVIKMLTDRKRIKRSLVLPFRYVSAIDAINGNQQIISAINKAVDISCDNVPKFDGKTLVAIDYSGSMGEKITDKKGQATLFGIVMAKSNDADIIIFGSRAQYVPINRDDSTLSIIERFLSYNTGWDGKSKYDIGHGTNFNEIFLQADKKYDRIFIFSDMQGWEESSDYYDCGNPKKAFSKYKKDFNIDPFIYSFDLSGYGTLMFPKNKVFCLTGLSEKVFDMAKLMEQDKQALINTIEAYDF